jgi:hypothetical protein
MEALWLCEGNTTIVRFDNDVEGGKVQRSTVVHNNICVKLSGSVHIHTCNHIEYGKQIHVLPIDDSVKLLPQR